MRNLGLLSRIARAAGTANERNRDEWLQQTLAGLPGGSLILDAGAGEGRYKEYCSHLRYTSQDLAEYDGGGGHGLHTGSWDTSQIDIKSDIIDMPVDDGAFDVVMCTEVLEHVPYPEKALVELVRVLRPGGTLILTAPVNSLTHFAPFHYSTGFNRYFYEFHLAKLGVEIEALVPNGSWFEVLAQELRRLDQVSRTYTPVRQRRIEIFAQAVLLRRIELMSASDRARHDFGSADLTSYGLHIKGKKAPRPEASR